MLIDINTRVGRWPFKNLRHNTFGTLLERMDHFGVERAVVSSMEGIFYANPQPANEALYGEWKTGTAYRKRFIPFAVINPSYPGWETDLAECHEKWGMKGICLYPDFHDYDPGAPFVLKALKAAAERKLVVSLPLQLMDARQRSWTEPVANLTLKSLVPLVRSLPEVRFLITNVAATGTLSPEDISILKQANLLFDTSGKTMNNFKSWLDRYGPEKIAYGSHAPILDFLSGRIRFEVLADPELSDLSLKKIRSENALQFLNL